jgi:aminoglycoside phosphotransferase (APT) family kinase protein
VSDAPLDLTEILDTLGVVGPARAIPVAGGADTLIWRVEAAGQVSALRLFRPEQMTVAQREVAAMAAASSAGLPVPRVYAEGIWRGRPVLHISWMPGRPLRDALLATPWRARTLGVRFGRAQAAVHGVPPPTALLTHPTPWIAWANPDNALRDCLEAAARGPDVLLHLDFHPMNVLVADGRVSAVLDWANARAGDPRADLARTASILRFTPLDPRVPRLLETVVLRRRAFIAGWRRGYREVAGPMGDMAPFYAWAGAVMIRDLTPRLGRPDLPWLDHQFLERVRQWADGWRQRAGCAAS